MHAYIFHVFFPSMLLLGPQVQTLTSNENRFLTNLGGPCGQREINQAQICNTQLLREGHAAHKKRCQKPQIVWPKKAFTVYIRAMIFVAL